MVKFNMKQQAEHCVQLADFLETVPSRNYNHGKYHCGTSGCALGWAAHAGIGGLHNACFPRLGDKLFADNAADVVFGRGAYSEIFCTYRPCRSKGEPYSERKISIARLRARAEDLAKRSRSKAA